MVEGGGRVGSLRNHRLGGGIFYDMHVLALAMTWKVAMVRAILTSIYHVLLILGVVASPTSPPIPSFIVKLAETRFVLFRLARTFIGSITGTEIVAIMETSARSSQGIIGMTQVTAPHPW